jgi:ATP-dependent Clp protease ATP-binding subunit ClpB
MSPKSKILIYLTALGVAIQPAASSAGIGEWFRWGKAAAKTAGDDAVEATAKAVKETAGKSTHTGGRTVDEIETFRGDATGLYGKTGGVFQDLHEKVEKGYYFKTFGRDPEVDKVMASLNDPTTPVIALKGPQFSGKSQIMTATQERIFNGDVPNGLKGAKIIQVDGDHEILKDAGSFSRQLEAVVEENKGDALVIVYFKDISDFMTQGSEKKLDNLVDLVRRKIGEKRVRVVIEGTPDEFQALVSTYKNSGLANISSIYVKPLPNHEIVRIAKSLAHHLKLEKNVHIGDEIVEQAMELSNRYLYQIGMPRSVINLLVRASNLRESLLHYKTSPMVAALVERKNALQADLEKALEYSKQGRRFAQVRAKQIPNELETLTKSIAKAEASFQKLQALKKRDLELQKYAEDLKRRGIKDLPEKESEEFRQLELEKRRVGREELALQIHKDTDVPLEIILKEKKTLSVDEMMEEIGKRVFGQDEAKDAVKTVVSRRVKGEVPKDKPQGSFLLLGPTGVGKTELMQALADTAYEGKLIRKDMSEFLDKHQSARLTGGAPGLVGYEEGGEMYQALSKTPETVVLFDEIEKGDTSIFDMLLQVLDNGKMSNSKGQPVYFNRAAVAMTSNALDKIPPGATRDQIEKLLLAARNPKTGEFYFRPEFLQRIEFIVVFQPIEKTNYAKILRKNLDRYNKSKAGDLKRVVLTPRGESKILAELTQFEVPSGRDILRVFKSHVENVISNGVYKTANGVSKPVHFNPGDLLKIDYKEGEGFIYETVRGL